MSWRFLRALSCPARIIAAVSPLIPIIAGVAALIAGFLIFRSYGPSYRVGRLLAVTPTVTIAEARALASGPPRYVKVSGRIDSETEFEDDAHRPLVFRRTRLQLRKAADWVTFEDGRERVPFEVREGLDAIAVNDDDLDTGLVVIPRELIGSAADVADRVPPGTASATPVRLRIEQVSSVEHAIVVGVPTLDAAGAPWLAAGLGRPLVLTTLERPEAMRILADGDRRRPLVATISLAGGLVLITAGIMLAVVEAIT